MVLLTWRGIYKKWRWSILTNSMYGMSTYYNIMSRNNSFIPSVNNSTKSFLNSMQNVLTNKLNGSTYDKQFQASVSSYLTNLDSEANILKASLSSLSSSNYNSSFNKKATTFSDSSAVSGVATTRADTASYTLKITQLATSQINTGTALNSSAKSLNQGLNTLSIKVGNSDSKNISYNILDSDTNNSALTKMAKAINMAKTGVTASVIEDSKSGTSHISLKAENTGTKNTFTIKDVIGNGVSTSGSDNGTEVAKDANYSVDGKAYTSQSNVNTIDKGKVTLSFSKAESKDIKVNVGTDTSSIKTDIKKFVTAYNDMMDTANTNTSAFKGAQYLSSEFSNVVKTNKSTLNSMGITMNSDNTISLDEKKLDQSLKSNVNKVKDVFGGYGGIADKLTVKANDIMSSPQKYTKTVDFANDLNNDYYNYMTSTNMVPYAQNMNTGILFSNMA